MASRLAPIFIVGLAVNALAGCTGQPGEKRVGGTLVGAALGGLAGSHIGRGHGRLAATAAGTIIGAMVGNEVGRSLDRVDRAHARRTAQQGLEQAPTGSVSGWHNPDTGHSGTFQPTRTYRSTDGEYCREFQETVTIAGRTERAYGTACRQPDGSWRIADST